MQKLNRFVISVSTMWVALISVACEPTSATSLAGTPTIPESTRPALVTATELDREIATDVPLTPTVSLTATKTPSVDELRRRQDSASYSTLATLEAERSGVRVSNFATVSAPPAPGSPKSYLAAAVDQLSGFDPILFDSQPYVDSDGSIGQRLRLERYSDQGEFQESVDLDLKLAMNVNSASEQFAICSAIDALPGYSLTSLDMSIPATDTVIGWLLTPDDHRDWTMVILCARKDVAVLRVVVSAPSSVEVAGNLSGRASNLALTVSESVPRR